MLKIQNECTHFRVTNKKELSRRSYLLQRHSHYVITSIIGSKLKNNDNPMPVILYKFKYKQKYTFKLFDMH